MRVWSLGWEDPLEKKVATQSIILAWRIPWMEKSGRLQSIGSQRVRHNWSHWVCTHSPLLYPASSTSLLLLKHASVSPPQGLCTWSSLWHTCVLPMDCNPPGSSVHGIIQARTGVGCHSLLRGSSWPRDRSQVFCIAGRFFNVCDITQVDKSNHHGLLFFLVTTHKKDYNSWQS